MKHRNFIFTGGKGGNKWEVRMSHQKILNLIFLTFLVHLRVYQMKNMFFTCVARITFGIIFRLPFLSYRNCNLRFETKGRIKGLVF